MRSVLNFVHVSLALLIALCRSAHAEACAPLRPGPGQFESQLETGYESAVARLLLTPEKFVREAQMVQLAPRDPWEFAVYLVDSSANPPVHHYELVTVRSLSSILDAVMHDGPGAAVPVETRRVSVDAKLAGELKQLWAVMVRRARFAQRVDIRELGTEYHFTAQLDIGPGSAFVEGPPVGTCSYLFAQLGVEMVALVRADASEAVNARAKLLSDIFRLRSKIQTSAANPIIPIPSQRKKL